MKTKLYKIVGVALTLVLLASLTVGLAGVPAGAASSNLKFTKLSLPEVEDYGAGWVPGDAIDPGEFANSEGDFWATPNVDLGPIAQSPDGSVLFAAVSDGPYGSAGWYHVLKSTDGGYSWVPTGFNDVGDGSPIVDIVTSPDYDEDSTLNVATEDFVYQSVDAGKRFVQMAVTGVTGTINDLDVTLDDRGRLAYMVGTSTDVFVMATATGNAWQDQDINDDVLACSFVPEFSDTEGICAVVTTSVPDTTTLKFSFGYIGEAVPGNGWGVDIANAPFTDALGDPFESAQASIGFPDDFDPWGIGTNVCFVGIYSYNGYWNAFAPADAFYDSGAVNALGDAYKVILKEAGTSSAVDLDVRGIITTLLPTVTEITSIDVCGPADAATIIVGTDRCDLTATPAQFLVYYSTDSGESWMPSFKAPTGGAEYWGYPPTLGYFFALTRVLMAPDYCDTGLAYASTQGWWTDAFQRTTDGGASFNQISIIDWGFREIPTVNDQGTPTPADDVVTSVLEEPGYSLAMYGFSAAGYIADGTLRMVMWTPQGYTLATPGNTAASNVYGAMWQRTGGKHWERILSYATPGVTGSLSQISAPGDGSALFAVDLNNGLMWRSTDGGATWPKKITTKDGLTWVTAVSATTLYTTHAAAAAGNSGIWWSTKSGVGWTKPDDSEIPNTAVVVSAGVMGDVVMCATFDGEVFISSDGGETVEKVGKNDPGPVGPPTIVTSDLGFGANGILYAITISVPNHGIWRTSVDLDDPGACKWERIDDNQDLPPDGAYDYQVAIFSPAIALPPSGILYTLAGADGLWRCTNPTADLDSIYPPYFENETKGLNGGVVGLASLDLAPPTLAPTFFCSDMAAPYNEQIVMYTDILNVGVPLTSPTADETGVGLLPEGYVYPEVNLLWQEMAGATSYQYQVAVDPDFKTKVAWGFTNSLATPPMDLFPNTNYYWRVRVANDGSLIGAPLISPWSEVWKFKTAIGASMARPDLQAPWPGEPDVPLSPTFEWSGIEWAEVYEYELALDPTTTAGGYFAAPLVALVGTDSLVSTAWKCDTALDYETRYYWHVKAIGVDTDTPWSDVGTFITMGTPPVVTDAPPPIVVEQPDVITPAWIWAIVIIGAILVIAVIVLIVTTRRVP